MQRTHYKEKVFPGGKCNILLYREILPETAFRLVEAGVDEEVGSEASCDGLAVYA
jgi:hypothetical protein